MAHVETIATADPWDPLHSVSDPRLYWTTDNVGEALPGLLTPLGWTFWRPVETMTREIGYQLGIFQEFWTYRYQRAMRAQRLEAAHV